MKTASKTRKLVTVGMLSSIAYILQMLDFPLVMLPQFLKVDFSDVPALIAGIVFGPMAAIMVEGIKNILHYFIQGSATGVPVGEVANFIAGLIFILPTLFIFTKMKSAKGLTIGLILGTVLMTILMSILNYYIILPAYTLFLNMPAFTDAAARQMIVAGIMPFNFIKGIFVTVVFLILFSKMRKWFENQIVYKKAA